MSYQETDPDGHGHPSALNLARASIATLVEGYLKFDSFLEDEKNEFERRTAPLKEILTLFEGAIADRMNAEGLDNVRTPCGTPYFSTLRSVKVTDTETWFAWVLANGATDVLTAAVSKEGLAARGFAHAGFYEDLGVRISEVRKLHIRRSS